MKLRLDKVTLMALNATAGITTDLFGVLPISNDAACNGQSIHASCVLDPDGGTCAKCETCAYHDYECKESQNPTTEDKICSVEPVCKGTIDVCHLPPTDLAITFYENCLFDRPDGQDSAVVCYSPTLNTCTGQDCFIRD